LNVRVNGQVTFNTSEHIVTAALAGLGIAFLPEQEFGAHIEEGRLIRVLETWCQPFLATICITPAGSKFLPHFRG
jgi:DNA-binding transcriptional LysR family regulator